MRWEDEDQYPPRFSPRYGQPPQRRGMSTGWKIFWIILLVMFGPGIICEVFTLLRQVGQSVFQAMGIASVPVFIAVVLVLPTLLTLGLVAGVVWLVVRRVFGGTHG